MSMHIGYKTLNQYSYYYSRHWTGNEIYLEEGGKNKIEQKINTEIRREKYEYG